MNSGQNNEEQCFFNFTFVIICHFIKQWRNITQLMQPDECLFFFCSVQFKFSVSLQDCIYWCVWHSKEELTDELCLRLLWTTPYQPLVSLLHPCVHGAGPQSESYRFHVWTLMCIVKKCKCCVFFILWFKNEWKTFFFTCKLPMNLGMWYTVSPISHKFLRQKCTVSSPLCILPFFNPCV